MVNYLLTSFFIHAAILLALFYIQIGGASGGEKIEVNIVEGSKSPKMRDQKVFHSVSRKYAKHGPGEGTPEKGEKIDLTDYANQLKTLVDPVWYGKIEPLHLPKTLFLTTEVLLFPDKYGSIVSVKVVKSSGSRDFDQLAIDALREVNKLPKPSDSLVKEGIIWEFSTDERR